MFASLLYKQKLLYPWSRNISELQRKINKVLNTMTYDEDHKIDICYVRTRHERFIMEHRCLVYIDEKQVLDTECFSMCNYNSAVIMVADKQDEKRQFIHNPKKKFKLRNWHQTKRDYTTGRSFNIEKNYMDKNCDCKLCVFCRNNYTNVCVLVDTIDVVLNKNFVKYETEQKKNELTTKQQKIQKNIVHMKHAIDTISSQISDAEKEYNTLQKELDELNR